MGLRVNNNIAAFNSYRNLQATDKQLNGSLEKLSSGFRINKAADDSAGLVVSEGLRSQINGMSQAVRNAQDGVNVAQTADGALGVTTSILQRMRDLAVQASNGGSQDSDAQKAANLEFGQLKAELSRIAETTAFGGQKLLDGSYTGQFQVGANSGEQISVALDDTVFGAAVTAVPAAKAKITLDADTLTASGNFKLTVGATDHPITLDATPTAAEIGASIVSAIGTDNFTVTVTGTNIAIEAKTAVDDTYDLAFTEGSGTASGVTVGTAATPGATEVLGSASGFNAAGLNLDDINLIKSNTATIAENVDEAQKAIRYVDNALKGVSTARATIGAVQNRFEHAVSSLNVSIENITASESAIRDTDMAAEMTKFTKNQILSQAGTSMLAQANSASQNILSLLRG
ncbi:flagellin N-terminal helical domain-containing protein [Kineococcus auxinigenes]|uniref:flagellin N-terminal helical domain-containing protein n=1 Tax=unclassified Kineococcus TaxID=2621656 RepID=UPI003D7E944A